MCVKSYIEDKTKLRFNSDLSFFTVIHDIVKERIYSNTFPDNFPMVKGLAKDIGEDCVLLTKNRKNILNLSLSLLLQN